MMDKVQWVVVIGIVVMMMGIVYCDCGDQEVCYCMVLWGYRGEIGIYCGV